MTNEEIKDELIKRGKALFAKHRGSTDSVLDNLIETLKNSEPFTKDLTRVLNDILKENNINLEGKEKEDFIEFIKPTMLDLTKNYIAKSRD